jgi:membrane dipeptidase
VSPSSRTLHEQSIVIDLVCPLASTERYLDEWIRGGATAIGPTVASDDDLPSTMTKLATWHARLARMRDTLLHVTTVADVRRAKQQKKLGIIFHFQNTQPFERNPDLVELYYRLGVRVAQLTYNTRNWVGDGCEEPANSGLSDFGRRIVREMNRVGMVVDLSHTGHRTTMEAMEVSTAPVIFSHSNPRGRWDHGRNIRDEQIKACAAGGGVIGINGVGIFLGPNDTRTEVIADHVDYVADLVGARHIGIGLDYAFEVMADGPDALLAAHPDYWPAGNHYDTPRIGIAAPAQLRELTDILLRRNWSDDDLRGILGGNFQRIAGQVWK